MVTLFNLLAKGGVVMTEKQLDSFWKKFQEELDRAPKPDLFAGLKTAPSKAVFNSASKGIRHT